MLDGREARCERQRHLGEALVERIQYVPPTVARSSGGRSRLGLGVSFAWQGRCNTTMMSGQRDGGLLTARAASRAAMRRLASDGGSGWCRSPSLIFSMASSTTGMSICAWLRRTCGRRQSKLWPLTQAIPQAGLQPRGRSSLHAWPGLCIPEVCLVCVCVLPIILE